MNKSLLALCSAIAIIASLSFLLVTPTLAGVANFERTNVKFYGAKGDGVTDDTAAINAAIAAQVWTTPTDSKPSGLLFPKGIYLYGNPDSGSPVIAFNNDNQITTFESGAILMPNPKAQTGSNVLVTGTRQVFYNLTIRDDLQPTLVKAGTLLQLLEVQGNGHHFYNIEIDAMYVTEEGIRIGRGDTSSSLESYLVEFFGGHVRGNSSTRLPNVPAIFNAKNSNGSVLIGISFDHWDIGLKTQGGTNLSIMNSSCDMIQTNCVLIDGIDNTILTGLVFTGNYVEWRDASWSDSVDSNAAAIFIKGANVEGAVIEGNSFPTNTTLKITRATTFTNVVTGVNIIGNKTTDTPHTIFNFEDVYRISVLDLNNDWGANTLVTGGGADKLATISLPDRGRVLKFSTRTQFDNVDSLTLRNGGTWQAGTAAPTSSSCTVGAITWNSNPNSGDYIGWVCTTTGSWAPFGKIGS